MESRELASLVSVVLPAHNCAAFVGQAVESLWAQRDPDLEVIVVDDGSTDSTLEVLRSYADRIVLVSQPNGGVSSARNRGLATATGDWVAFLDADDVWAPSKLALQRAATIDHPGVALVFSSFRLVDEANRCLVPDAVRTYYRVFKNHRLTWTEIFAEQLTHSGALRGPRVYAGDCYGSLFLGNFIKTSTVMARRDVLEALGGFDPSLSTEEDYDLWLRLALEHRVAYVDAPLADIRRRTGQLTSGENAVLVAWNAATVVERTAARATHRIPASEVSRRLADAHRNLARVALFAGDHRRARQSALACARWSRMSAEVLAILAWSVLPSAITRATGKVWRRLRRAVSA